MGREALRLPSLMHANPIPVASRVGPLLASGALTGRDPVTGDLPTGLDAQVENVFGHIAALMDAADSSTDAIVKITFHLVDYRDRDALNRAWRTMFPDPATMPARQVLAAALDGGALVHADLLAWLG